MKRTLLITVIGIITLMTGCIARPDFSAFEVSTEEKSVEEAAVEENVMIDNTKTSEDESEAVKEETAIDLDELNRLRVRDGYCELLTEFSRSKMLPDGYFNSSDFDDSLSELEEPYDWQEGNEYAFADVNGDGQEELLLSLQHNFTSSCMGYIYKYDPLTGAMVNEMTAYPVFEEVYNNGVIKMGISHNQGMAGDLLWPYDLWVYDSESKTFNVVGTVDAWDGNSFPTDHLGKTFPYELDKDGDGVLYSYEWDEENDEYKWVDNSEYEQWLNVYIGDAALVPIDWKAIGDYGWCDDVKKLTNYIIDYNEKVGNFEVDDIGYSYMKNVDGIDLMELAEDIIIKYGENYGLDVEKEDDGMPEITAFFNEIEIFYSNYDTMYALNYINEQIGDVTILGIYPGMPYDEAKDRLESMYLYSDDQSIDNEDGSTSVSFKTGGDVGNFIIYLDCEEGIVKRVSINDIFSI